jgi:replicative DNA helicase
MEVPVMALSQLSRAVEQRGTKDRRPQLSDLRESGSIEQDADVVMFVYRDDYYDQESEHKGEAEIIVAKHRSGPLDTVNLVYQGRYTRFANMARGAA